MTYTVRTLINKSWYLSGIVARDFEDVSGAQITEGLDLLNELLANKTANNRLIPYYTAYSFNATVGQEEYAIPNLIWIESITFNQNVVRFSMYKQGRKNYFGSPRVDNISSLPFNWHLEREKGGARLFIYFLPSQNFPIKIRGKFSLASVTLNQDLDLTLDKFYISYLRYALAEYMCNDYNVILPPGTANKLAELEEVITDVSPMDLSQIKVSTLGKDKGLNWAQVNFPGWTP